jgi:hypothetical protein
MSYLRYTNKLDLFNITTEPTENQIFIKYERINLTEINVIIGLAIAVVVVTFVGFFCYCRKKERDCC